MADGLAGGAVHDGLPRAFRAAESLGTDVPTLVALLVCLIPTTIGALLAAIGIAGMERALQANIIAKSGKAVELAGDVDIVLLDKTGTITMGNRHATKFLHSRKTFRSRIGRLGCPGFRGRRDAGRSQHRQAVSKSQGKTHISVPADSVFIPFTAQTRMSGIDLPDGRRIRKGAPDAVLKYGTRSATGKCRAN